jgi:protein-disulfide isomerase
MSMDDGRLTVPVGAHDHIEGDEKALVTLVEYGDYQCPYCGQAYPIVKELQKDFGTSLRLVFRNMPLSNVHPFAQMAAEAAEAVAAQDKFWPMHDLLFENQDDLKEQSLLRYAQEAGADSSQVEAALTQGTMRKRVNDDIESGIRSGVNGTPTFFVNNRRYDGSWAYDSFYDYLEELLNGEH